MITSELTLNEVVGFPANLSHVGFITPLAPNMRNQMLGLNKAMDFLMIHVIVSGYVVLA